MPNIDENRHEHELIIWRVKQFWKLSCRQHCLYLSYHVITLSPSVLKWTAKSCYVFPKKITEALGPPQIQIWDACVEVPVWAAWVDHNKPEEAHCVLQTLENKRIYAKQKKKKCVFWGFHVISQVDSYICKCGYQRRSHECIWEWSVLNNVL